MQSNDAVNDTLQIEKRRMRDAILDLRDAMQPGARGSASRVIMEKVAKLPAYQTARTVLTYIGFGSEIETQSLFERAIADGKTTTLPRVDRATQTLVLHSVKSMAELTVSKWNIREPHPDAPIVPFTSIEFMLLPGVAFDRAGNRLGYGRGYYDKLLLAVDPALARVAACFSCQIVKAVPAEPHDQKIDSLITENEIINTSHDR